MTRLLLPTFSCKRYLICLRIRPDKNAMDLLVASREYANTIPVYAHIYPYVPLFPLSPGKVERYSRRNLSPVGKNVFFVCCLVFFVVWAFRMLFFFAVWAGACFVFCCLGGGPGPAQTAKTKTRLRPNSKNKTRTRPFRACFFLLFGRMGVFLFLLFGRGSCFFFFAVWAGGRVFFCCLGGGVFFFAVWAGACAFFCCLGRGRVFFFAVWAGDESSLTYPSAWLVFKRPNNKRDRTAKKKHGFPPLYPREATRSVPLAFVTKP